jgi:DNA-binding transcriptional LysR family regulator
VDLIKGFVAVARRMSVTKAADDLCLTQSAISKQIRLLEESLGVLLFTRGFRSLALTEHGQILFQAADAAMLQLQETIPLLRTAQRRPVTITASTSFSGLWLLPRMGEFVGRHPWVDVRLIADNAIVETGSAVDLAVRYCSERQAPRGSVALLGETIVPVAHPACPYPAIESGDILGRLTLLEFDLPGRPWLHWGPWLAARGWTTSMARGVLHFNQYEQMIQACARGQGVALGRVELLHSMLQERVLVRLEEPAIVSDHRFWLIQRDSGATEEVGLVVDWLLELAGVC